MGLRGCYRSTRDRLESQSQVLPCGLFQLTGSVTAQYPHFAFSDWTLKC